MFASRCRGAVVATIAAFVLLAALPLVARATAADSTQFALLLYPLIDPVAPCAQDTVQLELRVACPKVFTSVQFVQVSADSATLTATTLPFVLWPPSYQCAPTATRYPLGVRIPGRYVEKIAVHVVVPADSGQAGETVMYEQQLPYTVSPCVVPVAPAPFVTSIVVGTAPCTTCDPKVCAGQPIAVTVNGTFPNGCWRFEGLDLVPSKLTVPAPPMLVVKERFVGNACTLALVPFTGSIVMGGLPKGTYTLQTYEVRSNAVDSNQVGVPVPNTPFTALDSCKVVILPTPVVQQVAFENNAPCDSCAPPVCGNVPLTITVSGTMPNACWSFTGLSLLPTASPSDQRVVVANFRDPCPSFAPCTGGPVPFSATIALSPGAPGVRSLGTWVRMRSCTDSAFVSVLPGRNFAYTVLDTCAAPTALTPVIEHVSLGDSLCAGCGGVFCSKLPLNVTVSGTLPNACWAFSGLSLLPTMSPISRPIVIARFRAPCSDSLRCTADAPVPFTGTISISPGPAGAETLLVFSQYHSCVDSTATGPVQPYRVAYTVTDSCAVPPVPVACVFPFLEPVASPGLPGDTTSSSCALTIGPGGEGPMTFAARPQGIALAGLQGQFAVGPHLHIVGLDRAAGMFGMHLITKAIGDTAVSFVLYADRGAPIPADRLTSVLTLEVAADSALKRATTSWALGTVSVGSDSAGRSIAACSIETLRWAPAQVCIVTPGASCDVNADGRTDVADLVRMARCWFRPETCPDTLSARPDCNGDGAFHVDDILCCARTILGGGGHDSTTHAAARLHVALGAAHSEGGDLLSVPLEISGATEMNGALLHIRYPSDRYMAVAPMIAGTMHARPASAGTTFTDPWLPLTEIGSDDVVVGVLRLDSSAPDAVTVPLYFRLRPGASAGGDVSVDASSVTGTDGSALTVDLSATSAPLPVVTPITRVELLVGPNPSRGAMSFVVRLPQVGHVVDLSLFDLAGRRVVTVAHGTYPAGESSFTWTASSARSGVYFARLSVDGVVRTSRVVMQLGH